MPAYIRELFKVKYAVEINLNVMFALKHPGVRFGPKNSSLMTLEGEIVYNFVVAQPSLNPSLGVQMIAKTCWTK